MLLEKLNAFLWGPFMLVILSGTGLWFTLGTGFLQLRRFPDIFKYTLGSLLGTRISKQGVSPFAALSTALASCIGTGNIAGVASALVMGGPGALFWMWVSAFLSMATKYAEVALAVRFRKKQGGIWRGGPMYYIEYGLGRNWKWLAMVFSGVCVISTLGTGNLTQIGAMSAALHDAFGVTPLATGIAASLLTAMTVFGGVKGVSRVSEKLVPLMSLMYIGGAAAVLVFNAGEILPALQDVVSSALGWRAAGGGAAGYTVARAMRYGAARGVFSNEAGMGSSPMVHASAETDSPDRQGLWGALEVFVDTLLMCTLTGLVILVSGALHPGNGQEGAALTGAAFSMVFGKAGPGFVAVSISLFALTSIMGWSCYGEAGCIYLFGERKLPLRLYRAAYLCIIPVGSVLGMERIWAVSDLLNSAMLLPNLTAILLLSGTVFRLQAGRDTRKSLKKWSADRSR